MKKIFILVLLLAPFISGCSVTKAEPQDSVTITTPNNPFINVTLTAGDQIKPGKMSVTVKDVINTMGSGEVLETINGRMEKTDNSGKTITYNSNFEEVDYSKGWPTENYSFLEEGINFRKFETGQQVDTNIDVKDGEKITFTTGILVPMGYTHHSSDYSINYAEVEIKSDGSGEYDDSWKVEKEGLKSSQDFNMVYENKEQFNPVEELYFRNSGDEPVLNIGEEYKGGFVKVTCNSSSIDKCSVELSGETIMIPNKEATLQVGESFVFPYVCVGGEELVINPTLYHLKEPLTQNITVEILDKK